MAAYHYINSQSAPQKKKKEIEITGHNSQVNTEHNRPHTTELSHFSSGKL